jgi:D-alanyl-D-alanine dipeptidase
MTSGLRLSCVVLLFCAPTLIPAQNPAPLVSTPKPPDIPQLWKPWIGEYSAGPSSGVVYDISEKDGSIWILQRQGQGQSSTYNAIERIPSSQPPTDSTHERNWHLSKSGARALIIGGISNTKSTPDFNARQQVLIRPVRPIAELRAEALASSPPHEDGPFRKPELVEFATLDPAIHLDIRYATSNDFLGTPVYTQARAFLERPAAEALVHALHKLKPLGYGLLIHDAYRPWYVTKIFWDATPTEDKIFTADPSQGSGHNRGCAVDLTLYDLSTGKPIEMPGTYDETSPRSFPDYPGGTSLQRWHRDLLRRFMESEGFTVYETEWWHFDYKDWREYPILNVRFEDLSSAKGLTTVH